MCTGNSCNLNNVGFFGWRDKWVTRWYRLYLFGVLSHVVNCSQFSVPRIFHLMPHQVHFSHSATAPYFTPAPTFQRINYAQYFDKWRWYPVILPTAVYHTRECALLKWSKWRTKAMMTNEKSILHLHMNLYANNAFITLGDNMQSVASY